MSSGRSRRACASAAMRRRAMGRSFGWGGESGGLGRRSAGRQDASPDGGDCNKLVTLAEAATPAASARTVSPAAGAYSFAFHLTLPESQVSVTAPDASWSVHLYVHFPETLVRALLKAPVMVP